ncbi:predicted protein [Plenodomus lingam JN3]|uniref:Predicted protein n=1 Tax=Leptosphaeria maculans (strain JN3 / isolate v23.1.3 / race Av1-4-5-6-7-8) TaxID=985895 RepID=E5AAU3_LEPMJ|nr:predicted protein [Plenodomus lingam JN3]CBY00784.1 predicted protein [Plenodomus lingam JN3]
MAATGMAMSQQAAIELPQASQTSPRGYFRSPRHSRQLSVPAVENHLHNFYDLHITGPAASALGTDFSDCYCIQPNRTFSTVILPSLLPKLSQHSLTGSFFENCKPFISRATSTIQQHTSRSSSPTKSLASFIPSRSAAESSASQPKIRALQNWFNGSSAPVKLVRFRERGRGAG